MKTYRFGDQPSFELQVRERRLLVDGKAIRLGSRALDVLIMLAEHSGRVVGRSALIDRVWPDRAVEENNLSVQISVLRRVLGRRTIVTVAGRGYSFTPQLRAEVAGGATPRKTAVRERFKTNLPASLATMFGRDTDIGMLEQLTAQHRLVTILGAGGMGKTLLAKHLLRRLAPRFPHGVCFVDLSSLGEASAIPGTISAALGMQPGAGEPLAGLAETLEPAELLVALDGAEHMIDGVARVAAALHDRAPGLHLLVTSQAPLDLAIESRHRIGPLAVPEAPLPASQAMAYGAIELFAERAMSADSRFVLTDDGAAAAIELCRALDGLPLAIELAASRAPVLGMQRLSDSMHQPLKLLATSNRDMPKRLQTLRGALDWSHGLLVARDQVVWRRMGVLVGSADLDLVRHVVCDPVGEGPIDDWAAVDALSSLVERSLVVTVHGEKSGVRYRLLDTPRAFAREQLVAAGEWEALCRRHAVAVTQRFERAHAERFSDDIHVDDWQDRQALEIDNGHAALAWIMSHDRPEMGAALLPGLLHSTPREERARLAELVASGIGFVQRARPGPHTLWTVLESAQLICSIDAALSQSLAESATTIARQCVEELPDARWLYRALCMDALARLTIGETGGGAACLDEARAMEDASWPAAVLLFRWMPEVWLADRQSNGQAMYDASLRYVALARASGYPAWAGGLTLVNGALAAGRAEDAVRHGLVVLSQFEGTRHFKSLVETRVQLVGALLACDRVGEARAQSRAAWPFASLFGRLDAWADYQALLAALEHRLTDAAQLLGYADKLCAENHVVRTYNELAAVARTTHALRAVLSGPDMHRLKSRGASLRTADIEAIAFALPEGNTPGSNETGPAAS